MKKTKRGVERICVMLLAVILMVESVTMPVKGEIKKNVSTLGEPGEEQISDNSVEKYAEEMVSANFISEEETERAASAAKQEKVDAEMPAEGYSGIDGDLEWTIDSAGFLTVKGEGDFDGTPDWLAYNEEIKYAKVNVQEITSMKDFFKDCYYLEDISFEGTDTSQVTDMSRMFCNCVKINGIDLRGFDTTKVTTMKGMFSTCKNLNHIWMEGINTSGVTDMGTMFKTVGKYAFKGINKKATIKCPGKKLKKYKKLIRKSKISKTVHYK